MLLLSKRGGKAKLESWSTVHILAPVGSLEGKTV